MNLLSKDIYDKAGLATTALKTLYSDTQTELTSALSEQAAAYAEQQAQILAEFDEALASAKVARNQALLEANQAYTDAIKEAFDAYKEDLKAIEKEYKDKLSSIENLSAALKKQGAMLASQITTANEFVPRGIQPVNDMQLLPFIVPSTQDKPASTVNINVKVDPTTSVAQVGKKIATVVQRYTAVGGGAGGSAMPWQVM
jgi:flagellar biosynthesis/type III secretory pathway protein FliH